MTCRLGPMPCRRARSVVGRPCLRCPGEAPRGIAAGGHLAHDRQIARIQVERLANELVHHARSVILRGVDMVDPPSTAARSTRRASSRSRGGPAVSSPAMPAPIAGELHRAVPDTTYAPGTQGEAPCGHGWTTEPKPRSMRIDSRMMNVVLTVNTSAAARTPVYLLMTGAAAGQLCPVTYRIAGRWLGALCRRVE